MSEPWKIAVGEPFPVKRHTTEDSLAFEYMGTGPFLLFNYSNPSESEIKMVAEDAFTFRWLSLEDVLFLLVKPESIDGWMDAPFNARIYDGQFDIRNIGHKPVDLHIVLIDSNTNIVKATRLINMGPKSADFIWKTINEQYDKEFDRAIYHGELDYIYSHYTSQDLADHAPLEMPVKAHAGIGNSQPSGIKEFFY